MVDEKGLAPEVADRIESYVKLSGGKKLLDMLLADQTLTAVKDAATGLDEMKLLLDYCELFGVLDNVSSGSCIYEVQINLVFLCFFMPRGVEYGKADGVFECVCVCVFQL